MKKGVLVSLGLVVGLLAYLALDASLDWGAWRFVSSIQKATTEFGEIGKKQATLEANFANQQVGKTAPEISLPNAEGTMMHLSDFQGKYVMLDFWASWCLNCRQANPAFLKVYEKYKRKGFEIIAISLDRERNDWLRTIAEDNFEWTNLCDFRGIDSQAATEYGVLATPTTYLIDPEGTIIAKDFDSEFLDKKLNELLDN